MREKTISTRCDTGFKMSKDTDIHYQLPKNPTLSKGTRGTITLFCSTCAVRGDKEQREEPSLPGLQN